MKVSAATLLALNGFLPLENIDEAERQALMANTEFNINDLPADERERMLEWASNYLQAATIDLGCAFDLFAMRYRVDQPEEVAFWEKKVDVYVALRDALVAERNEIFGEVILLIPEEENDAEEWIVENLAQLAERPGIDPRVVMAHELNEQRVQLYPYLDIPAIRKI